MSVMEMHSPARGEVGFICQLCMGGPAQIILHNDMWQPWPLVLTRPDDAPCLACPCPECRPEQFEAWRLKINANIEAAR